MTTIFRSIVDLKLVNTEEKIVKFLIVISFDENGRAIYNTKSMDFRTPHSFEASYKNVRNDQFWIKAVRNSVRMTICFEQENLLEMPKITHVSWTTDVDRILGTPDEAD